MIREYKDYLADIIDAIDKIELFVKSMKFETFEKDAKTTFAVIRAFEIMGEAVKKIPSSVRNKHKNLPWKEMAGMRDKLIHEYFGIKPRVVWKTIKQDLPTRKLLTSFVPIFLNFLDGIGTVQFHLKNMEKLDVISSLLCRNFHPNFPFKFR